MGRRILLATVLLLALPGQALAEEPTVHVLTFGAGALPPPGALQATRRAEALLGGRAFVVEGPLLTLLELDDPLHVLGPTTETCDGRAVLAEQVTGGLEAARRAVDELEYGSARMLLAGGVDLLRCLSEPASPEVLYDLHFLSGLVAWNEGDPEQATAAFRGAVAVDPGRPWNEAYAPDARAAFLTALQESIAEPGPVLRIAPELRGRLLLDGRGVDDGVAVPRGNHLLQLSASTGFVSRQIELAAASEQPEIRLLGPAGLREALVARDPAVAGLLGTAAEAKGMDQLLLLAPDDAVEFDVSTRTFRRSGGGSLTTVAMQPRSAPQPGLLAGLVLVGTGAATGGLGFALHGSAWRQGEPWLEDATYGEVADYEALRRQNVAGFVVGVGGAAVLAAGVVVAIDAAVRGTSAKAAAVTPFGAGGPDGAILGLAGRF